MVATASAAGMVLDTFPKYLLLNAERFGDRPAMRHKDYGIWQSWTWSEQMDEVRALAIGLEALGVKHGDKIAIVGANRPRLYWGFAAAQSLGAIPVPVYADAVAEEMAYVLNHAEVRFAIVQDQEQVDKILSFAEKIPALNGSDLRRAARPARVRPQAPARLAAIQAKGRRCSKPTRTWRSSGKKTSARQAATTFRSCSTHPARPAARKAS